jgi:hypothetical protein
VVARRRHIWTPPNAKGYNGKENQQNHGSTLMPIHDWRRVQAGTFHDFHMSWIAELKKRFNQDLLPEGFYALAEQTAGETGPDVLTLQVDTRWKATFSRPEPSTRRACTRRSGPSSADRIGSSPRTSR